MQHLFHSNSSLSRFLIKTFNHTQRKRNEQRKGRNLSVCISNLLWSYFSVRSSGRFASVEEFLLYELPSWEKGLGIWRKFTNFMKHWNLRNLEDFPGKNNLEDYYSSEKCCSAMWKGQADCDMLCALVCRRKKSQCCVPRSLKFH